MGITEKQRIMRLQEMLKELKKSRQILTQAEFGELVGLKPAQVSDILNEKRPLTEKTLQKILISLPYVSPDWLLYGKGKMIRTAVPTGHIATTAPRNTGGVYKPNGGKHETASAAKANAHVTLDKALHEIAEQRKVIQKFQEQIDRLLTMLEEKTT